MLKYYKVEFTVQGKHFSCVVKFREGDRHWTCVYLNKDNKNDFFIRRETISQELIRYGVEINEDLYEHILNKVLNLIGITNEQSVSSY